MDMVLYSLLKNRIASTSSSKVDNVGGYEIRFADSIPTTCEQDTLYIITRDMNSDDKFIVGGKGIECIVFNDIMIGLGVLNGNIFFDGYDFLYDVRRVLFESTNGQIVANNTRETKIKSMSLTGRSVIEDNVIKVGQVNSIVIGDETIELNKELCSLPNGVTDTIDLIKGTYSCKVCKDVLDSRIKWRYVATYSGYCEFVISGYTGSKPEFLTNSSYLNTSVVETITEDNMIASSGFVASASSNASGKECIFVSNSVVKLRISSSRLSATTATALQEYLTNNPITILMQRKLEVVEEVNIPELMAKDGTTTITIEKEEEYLYPELTVELPLDQQTLV